MESLNRNHHLLLSALTIGLIGYALIQKQKVKRNKRRWWVRPWLNKRNQGSGRGVLSMVESELKHEDQENYRNFLRMDEDCFTKILNLIRSKIERKDTQLRQCISAEKRLCVTLRFLATGETLKSLSFSSRIAHNTLSKIIPEVLTAIVDSMANEYLKVPTTQAEWETIAADFFNLWNFPNCLGALDGKHIVFRPPRCDGSFYRNYKGTDSIVLLALVDANCKFLCVDIGVNGRISDGGVFARSAMSSAILNNTLNFPPDKPLAEGRMAMPFVIVGDDAFPLKERIMKPYRYRGLTHEQKVFNYRTSRARRVSENAFGQLSNRFRIFLQPINLSVEKIELITKTCCILHNFLTENIQTPSPAEEGHVECTMRSLCHQGGNKTAQWPAKVREEFQNYFNTIGEVPWQQKSIENSNL